MAVLFKALATSLFLALVGLFVGPFVAVMLMPFPPDVCGLYVLIPAATGAVYGMKIGAVAGLVLGAST